MVIAGVAAVPDHVQASNDCAEPVARIVSIDGTAEIKGAKQDPWRQAVLREEICPAAALHVGMQSRAAVLLLASETVLRVDENTTVFFPAPGSSGRSILDLIEGAIYFLTRTPRSLEVRTPFVNAGVEGTEFLISVEPAPGRAFVTVFEGTVAVTPPAGVPPESGRLLLRGPQSAVGMAGAAPRRLDPDRPEDAALWRFLVRPRDAVQWTLYYPPVLIGQDAPPDEPLPPALRDALAQLRRGAVAEALAALERVPIAERADRFHVVRASALLAVGRAEAARRDLDRAVALNPDNGDAFALLCVLAVKQLQTEQALELGRRAVAASPESAAAGIALSYAQQANFDLGAARETLRRTVEANPEDGLVWARLAEIELSLGYLDRALESAERAHEIMPDLSLANVILGFARLAQVDVAAAKQAFEAAIARESANPTAWLGLGLARIREGALADGRQHIEIAVALTPNDALLRSYLGKAYFEEKRDALASAEFDRAKILDPQDPTPYLYDAILKQTQNRPVEALRDIQKSIELNDNRAVYRSRLLLDEDRATRGTALARIYDTLGFGQLGLIEGAKSLAQDPANHSAHRFLSDSYAVRPRHEIARASELLQAQLLQPLTITPVQPSLLETDLKILEKLGPDRLGFNEFTSLFERNQLRLDATGAYGNNDTWFDEVALSGIHGPVSASIGQFHYETDGFRPNNDLQHDIYTALTQTAVSDALSLHLDVRRRESDHGDIRLNFDPDDFSVADRRHIEQDTARLGIHYAPSPRSDFVGSLSYNVRDARQEEQQLGFIINETSEDAGHDAQAKYVFHADRFNLTIGAGSYDIDVDQIIELDFGVPCPFPSCVFPSSFSREHHTAYTYTDISLTDRMVWTFGITYDDLEANVIDDEEIGRNVGLQWDVTDRFRLRLAYLETLKRALVVQETLEPTQIAGFTKLFDDTNGTQARRYGFGLDVDLTDKLHAGAEYSRRALDVPIIGGSTVTYEDQDEDLHLGYLYWTPNSQWALSLELLLERFEREAAQAALQGQPDEVATVTAPFTVRYFRSEGPLAGLFAEVGATYVHQSVDLPPSSTFGKDKSDFTIVDALIGYRLPRRIGFVSLEVRNLFDEDFLYQDMNIKTVEPSTPRFLPTRSILANVTLKF